MGWTPRVHHVPHGPRLKLQYILRFFGEKEEEEKKSVSVIDRALVFWDLSLVCLFKVLVLRRIIWLFPVAQHLRADDRNGAQHKARLRKNI